MPNSFLPQHTPELAHPLFASIIGLLEFFLFLIESFEVVVFCDDGSRSAIELATEVRDRFFQSFPVRNNCFFPLLSLQPCPHGSPLLVFPSVILSQCLFFSHLSGVIAGVHLFPSVFVAIVIETMLPARDFVMSPSGSPLMWLLWDPVLSWVRFHLLSPVVVMGDACFFRSPAELWVPACPLFFAEMDLASIVRAIRPVHGGVRHLSFW